MDDVFDVRVREQQVADAVRHFLGAVDGGCVRHLDVGDDAADIEGGHKARRHLTEHEGA